jgi:hypothetical protein
MASSINNSAWLEWMATLFGGMSRQTYAATFPPDLFFCLLDELPLHLLPRRVSPLTNAALEDQVLYLNPHCRFHSGGEVPDELAARRDLVSAFALQGTIAWVSNDRGDLSLPFWLGPELEALVRDLRVLEPIPTAFPERARSTLASAGILLSEESMKDRHAEREFNLPEASALFRKKGYAPLGSLIHPFHIAALRRYYRHRIRTGAIRLGDGQSPRRYVGYNDPVARFFHQHIASHLSAVAGEPVKPSYVYLASYLSGAELRKHTDREQCEFSITFCLDFSPEPEVATPWPIQLDTPSGSLSVYQAIGDGLAYRGTRLPHYRSKLSDGQTSTSIFFHYVAADFSGSLD